MGSAPTTSDARAATESPCESRRDDAAILASATNPDGSQRFYPLGEHPAGALWREQLARLEAMPESPDRNRAIDRAKYELARFELGEDHAKRLYLEAHRGRWRRNVHLACGATGTATCLDEAQAARRDV